MTVIVFQPTSSWRHDFRRLEMRLFQIDEGNWAIALNRAPKDLHENYNSVMHRLHVEVLNQGLPVGETLATSDFDGTLPLIRLREDIIAPRIRNQPDLAIQLDISESRMEEVGLSHLL